MLQTFVLEDAIVCDKKSNPVELFTVNTQGPFTVRGRVIVDGPQTARGLARSMNTHYQQSLTLRSRETFYKISLDRNP